MPKGVYERKPKEVSMPENTVVESGEKPAVQMFPVLLTKNYQPAGAFEIIGYFREAVKQKDAAGNWHTVEPEKFVTGEMKPAPHPGVGFPGKVWAGTHIRLPLDEAKTVLAKKIAERADAIAA